MNSEQIKKITQQATERLVAALHAGHSDTLTQYLRAIGRFHRYSLSNVLLIASQRPTASYVAGFHTWHKLGRFVKKGEKGIMVLAPILRRKDTESEGDTASSSVAGFRAAYVFDVAQTEGRELPNISTVRGDPGRHYQHLVRFAAEHSIAVEYSERIAPARGISYGGRIALLPGQPPAEEFSTLVHELGHELLHRGDRRATTSKRVCETEAEAVAFVVCHTVGLETGSAAQDYIQMWNGSAGVLIESLAQVQGVAAQILNALSLEPPSLTLEKEGPGQEETD
jgi:antirestriction protein ArdC